MHFCFQTYGFRVQVIGFVGNFVALTNNYTIMKKILFLLAITLVMSSCAPSYNEVVTSFVYSDYIDEGFRITPFEFASQEFEVIGDIFCEFVAGEPKNLEDVDKVVKKELLKNKRKHSNSSCLYDIKFDYMMDKTVKEARRIGANGIMRFNWKKITDKSGLSSYQFTGVAVKFNK